jgi:DNA-binding SARP family transcriptional activator
VAKLRIQSFGGLQVFGPEQLALVLPAKKVQALLAYLALQPGRPQPRAKLAALLWSGSNEPQARASLRQALLVLRRTLALGDDELVAGPAESIALAAGCIDVDALEFERLVNDGGSDALERAATLYGGEFLEALDTREPAFDDWLMARRHQLRERAVDTLSQLLARHADSGRTERAIDAALRLLTLEPLQEPVHRTLMQLYAKQGRHAQALRQFQVCRDLLARELGAQPQAQTVQLRDAIARQRHAPAPDGLHEAPAQAAQAELRLVAILVADSTRITEDPDPEHAQASSERFAAAAGEIVERFGGMVERRLGASITALFGVPAAHTDDAERAARCALQLRGLAPDLRAGLCVGSVLVTRREDVTGQPLRVSGEAAGLAARLAAAAEPGRVLVSDVAWRALSRHADGMGCADAALPTSLRSPGCWQLTGMRSAPLSRARLVGRRNELAQFTTSLQACVQSGTGLTIHVRGDPGIGKTRLVEEFREIAAARGFACHTGLVLDFGIGAERDAVRSLVRGLLDVLADGAQDERAAVARAIATGHVDAGHELHLLDLLQLPLPAALRETFDAMDPPARDRGQRAALVSLLRRCSAAAPRLLVLEDMHWATARTLTQGAALAAAVEHCAALLVTTARTDGDPLNSAWRGAAGVSALVTLDLGPLRWEEAGALAAQAGDADDAFVLHCIERSGGNPLFLEQLLQGGRGAKTELPGSVQSVVQARLDRLGDVERNTVRVASVLGQRFALAALNHLLGSAPAWHPQFAHGLLRSEAGEGVFAHALVHEGAYASLPRAQRRELHGKAARWFAGRDPVLRAEHLDRAEQPGAAQAYLDAARSEATAHRHENALRLAQRGLALVDGAGPRFALECCRADLLHDIGSMAEAQDGYDAALAAAGDDVERCRAWLGLAAVLRVRDDLDGAATALERAEQAAMARGQTEQRSRVHFLRGNLLFPRGDLEGCRREHEQSLLFAREAGCIELEAAALGGLGDAAFLRGQMLTARQRFDACVALARREGLKRIEAANRPMAAITRWYGGDTRGALEDARDAIDLAARIGHRRAEAIAHHGAYQFNHSLMAFDAALGHAERALVLARQIDAPRFEAEALAFRAELAHITGRRAQALDDLRHALTIARATGMSYMGPIFLGMLAVAADDPAVREEALAEAEALLASNALAHNHLLFRRDAIDACLEAGDPAGVLRHAGELEAKTRSQPLPWSEFFIARGRVLATHGATAQPPTAKAELLRLRQEGQRLGLLVALGAIEAALATN